jgi:dihydrofolate reductase
MSRDGAELVREAGKTNGVLVTGRRTFDIAGPWGGRHPMDVPVVVVTDRVPQEWVKVGRESSHRGRAQHRLGEAIG